MKLFLLPGKLYLVQRDWELKKKELLINDCNKYCDGISAKFRLERHLYQSHPCYRRNLGPIASLYRLDLTKVS